MAYGVVILAGAGLMTPVFHLDEVVQLGAATLLGLAAEVAEQFWVGW